jgi:hypothetical protein
MTLAAPLWLLLLLPWLALVAWLLWGRRTAAVVPFLDLWRSHAPPARRNRWFQPPPLALAAALLAILLSIVAASRPALRLRGSEGPLVTVIVDRGVTMSAAGRLEEAVAAARDALLAQLGPGPTEVILVPGEGDAIRARRDNWSDRVSPFTGPPADTSDDLPRAVRAAVARTAGPVVVLTDRPVRDDPRVIPVGPRRPLRNAGIVGFTLVDVPTTQAMVTLRNDTPGIQGTLTVESPASGAGAARAAVEIDLPASGEAGNYFVDLKSAGATARAALEVPGDEVAIDNVAYLARETEPARVEIRGDVPPEVRRVVEAYQAARPATGEGDGAAVVAVAGSEAELRPGDSGVIVETSRAGATAPTTVGAGDALAVRAHPVTEHVDWSRVELTGGPGGGPPGSPAGWEPVVSRGRTTFVAVRESDAGTATHSRRVWVNLPASPALARTPEYVVFWTDVLEWLKVTPKDALRRFSAAPARALGAEWRPLDTGDALPGLYRRSDGAVRAVTRPPVLPSSAAPVDSAARLAAFASRHPVGVPLLPYLAAGALACLCVAAVTWPGRTLTPPLPARTV